MAAEPSAKVGVDESEVSLEAKGGTERDPKEVVTRWLRELTAAEQHEKDWRERADKIVKLYRDERDRAGSDTGTTKRYNILYANTEVLKGALYSRCPAPDVRRRFLDKDHVSRVAALVLNRALIASIDKVADGEDFDGVMKSVVFDMVVPGRGQARVRYEPTIRKFEDAGQPVEEVTYECVESDYCEWSMFRYSPAKRWKKVRWVAFGELLTRDDLVEQFGAQIGNAVEMKWMPKGVEDSEENAIFKRALVWAIWNKTQRKVIAICDGYRDAPLKEVDDPLRLESFFPCPKPLYSIFSTDSLIPTPEYYVYQDHAIQLDEIQERIAKLTDALRFRGVRDGAVEELEQLAGAADNKFIAIKKYREFVEKGGLEHAFEALDISDLSAVILELMKQAEAKKAEIYELIGISDIMRGATDAGETLGAQEIKNQWGSIRVGPRQAEVQRFARDMIRLQAEIIAEHFSAKTLAQMTGIELFFTKEEKAQAQSMMGQPIPGQPAPEPDPRLRRPTWDEVLAVLRNDKLRGFKVDIETDSTIKPQADTEQKNRVEAIGAITGFLEKALPAVAQGAVPKKLVDELLMFGVRAFPVGAQLEEVLDEWAGGGVDEQPGAEQPNPEVAQLKRQVAELQPEADKNALEREKIAFGREELEDKKAERTARVQEAAAMKETKAMDAALERDLREREFTQRAAEAGTKEKAQQLVEGADSRNAAIEQALVQLQEGQQAIGEAIAALGAANQQAVQQMTAAIVEAVSSEKEIVRDQKGRATGMRVKAPAAMH